MITIDKAVEFIKKHNVLKEWSESDIGHAIRVAVFTHAMGYKVNDAGELKSLCIGKWHSSCCIHIVCICGEPGSLKYFVKHLKAIYPEVTQLTATRKGKTVSYSVNNFK